MVTFFVIFFVLVLVNVFMLVDSSISARSRAPKITNRIAEQSEIKIYPIDLLTNYKKAI